MRHPLHIIIPFCLLLSLASLSCTDEGPSPIATAQEQPEAREAAGSPTMTPLAAEQPTLSSGDQTAAPPTAEDVGRKIAEAFNATTSYLAERQDEFKASMEERLRQLDDKLAEAQDKAMELGDQARKEYERQITQLDEERQRLADELRKLGEKGQESLRQAMEQFLKSMNSTEERLRELDKPEQKPGEIVI